MTVDDDRSKMTINQWREAHGLGRFDFPEADSLYVPIPVSRPWSAATARHGQGKERAVSIDRTLPARYEPTDYTWQEFQRAFAVACTDAFEEYSRHPDPKLSPDPAITLPHSVFPLVSAMVNPITGKIVPITRISPFNWGQL